MLKKIWTFAQDEFEAGGYNHLNAIYAKFSQSICCLFKVKESKDKLEVEYFAVAMFLIMLKKSRASKNLGIFYKSRMFKVISASKYYEFYPYDFSSYDIFSGRLHEYERVSRSVFSGSNQLCQEANSPYVDLLSHARRTVGQTLGSAEADVYSEDLASALHTCVSELAIFSNK